MILTKYCVHKIEAKALGGPHIKVPIPYMEYLICTQMDYEDMEAKYNAVKRQEFLKSTTTPNTSQYQPELLQEQAMW